MSFIIISFNKNTLNALNHNNQKFGFDKNLKFTLRK